MWWIYRASRHCWGLPDSIRLSLLEVDSSRGTVHPEQQATPNLQDCDEVSSPVSSSASLTKGEILQQYSSVSSGLGNVGKPVSFVLDPHVVHVQAPWHRVSVAKRERVKLKLDKMVRDGKIAKVEEPTAWCSNMTVVERVKPDGSVKTSLCLDPIQTINKAIVIPKFTVPTLEEILPALGTHKHKCFTIVDALDGFTQVPLSEESSLVTAIHTPWGRYRWLLLPYGVSFAPEEFQKRMQEALDGLAGVGNIAHDILVYGLGDSPAEAETDHDRNLQELLFSSTSTQSQAESKEDSVQAYSAEVHGTSCLRGRCCAGSRQSRGHSTIPVADQQVSPAAVSWHGKLFECLLSESIICDPPSSPADPQRY